MCRVQVWKARCSAYEALSTTFSRTADESDPAFRPYLRDPDKLKLMVVDSNAVAQEKAVETVCKFVEFSGKEGGKTRDRVLSSVVEKCLGSTRAGTKRGALELTLLYVENEDVMGSEGIIVSSAFRRAYSRSLTLSLAFAFRRTSCRD